MYANLLIDMQDDKSNNNFSQHNHTDTRHFLSTLRPYQCVKILLLSHAEDVPTTLKMTHKLKVIYNCQISRGNPKYNPAS